MVHQIVPYVYRSYRRSTDTSDIMTEDLHLHVLMSPRVHTKWEEPSIMDMKCPYCGAETRPGDNYCLNCGNPLPAAAPSSQQQTQPPVGEATLAAPDDWAASVPGSSPASGWQESGSAAAANAPADQHNYRADSAAPAAQATMDRIEQPARFILRADNGDIVQEYLLDKPEMTVGRAQNSDILLSKDKLTSRHHATVRYENGQYIIHDDHSANGTFVNGEQIEEMSPHTLQDGDHIGIGEHELVFRAYGSSSQDLENLPTIATPFEAVPHESTYRTQPDEMATVATQSEDDFRTREEVEAALPAAPAEEEAPPVIESQPEPEASQAVPAADAEAHTPASKPDIPETPVPAEPVSDNITLSLLTSLEHPALPDISALMAALSTLDGQVTSLQHQLNTTQDAMRKHEADIAQMTDQLRAGLRRVSDRMDNTIANVARSREALAWSELSQLMEDVMNNPRDIEYVTKLARKARELNKAFLLHQNVLNAMAECNSLLRSLIGDE